MLTSDIIPITALNRGHASDIFDKLETGPKVIVKNNLPVCVMISPSAFDEMTAQLKEARLILSANKGENGLVSLNRVINDMGISETDLLLAEEDEIE